MLRAPASLRPVLRLRPTPFPRVTAQRRYAYPKEGVFQPNSPRWNPSTVNTPETYGYGRQPFPGVAPQPASPPPMSNHGPQQSQPPPRPPTRTSRILRWTWFLARVLLYYSVFSFSFEVALEKIPELFSTPFEPGSEEDEETLRELLAEYNELHEVNILRHCLYESPETGGFVDRFREWPAYRGITDADGRRAERFTTGPLAGSGGVAAQSIFVDNLTGAVCCLINFGEGTCSSQAPGIVHNGLVSTIFDETLGRVAIRSTQKHTAVTAKLDVHFLNACKPGQWYCIWARPISNAKDTESKKHVEAVMWCTGPFDESKNTPIIHYRGSSVPFEVDIKKSLSESDTGSLTETASFPSVPSPGTGPAAAIVGIAGDTAPSPEHPHAYATALFVVPRTVELQGIVEEF